MTSIELRQERAKVLHQARELLDKAETENRGLGEEEQAEYDKRWAAADQLKTRYEQMERQETEELGLTQSLDGPPAPETTNRALNQEEVRREATEEYADAFAGFLRNGAGGLLAEQRATLQVDLDTGGGFISASERFINKLLQNVDRKLVIRQLATVYKCGYEESLGVPNLSGDVGDFSWGAGELLVAEEDTGLALGFRELKPRPLRRKVIKISKRLTESARMNVENIVAERGGVALARTFEQAYMTGHGAAQPLGLFTASDIGISTSRDYTCVNQTTLHGDDFIGAQGMLDEAYQGPARWLIHRNGWTLIRKIKTAEGQYIWQPGLQAGAPDVILGKPYILGGYVPSTYTAGEYVAMYGDFSYYWIADAVSMQIQRLLELYTLTGQIGLLFDKLAADAQPVLEEAFVRMKLHT